MRKQTHTCVCVEQKRVYVDWRMCTREMHSAFRLHVVHHSFARGRRIYGFAIGSEEMQKMAARWPTVKLMQADGKYFAKFHVRKYLNHTFSRYLHI
jgi:hypothetical protein